MRGLPVIDQKVFRIETVHFFRPTLTRFFAHTMEIGLEIS